MKIIAYFFLILNSIFLFAIIVSSISDARSEVLSCYNECARGSTTVGSFIIFFKVFFRFLEINFYLVVFYLVPNNFKLKI